MTESKTIAQTNNFIILDKYTQITQTGKGHQTEEQLENELIADLSSQGYELIADLTRPK